MTIQPAILQPQRSFARYLTGRTRLSVDFGALRDSLRAIAIDKGLVIGLGPGLTRALGFDRKEMRTFPAMSGPGVEVPSTQSDLWFWFNCDDRASAVTRSCDLMARLANCVEFAPPVDGFKNGETENGLGRDLTGYEDGTENPEGDAATSAGVTDDGSSFVAVQMWKHDLSAFASYSADEQDQMIGRRKSDNEELEDAPPSAHVKRTAQESFTPEAWLLRRSLPWAGPSGEGLMFIAFGHSFDAFEAQMRRMAGLDDGITDACFRFSRPLTGGYYWCPPTTDGRLSFGSSD